MKIFCMGIALFIGLLSFSQEKYIDRNGSIQFEASVPSFEEVAAKNKTVSGILDTATGEFAALALMKAFRFKVALMEEHFNENYVDSDNYPKTIFKGKLENFQVNALTGKERKYSMKGNLTLHGKTVAITTPVSIKVDGDIIYLTSKFTVNPRDFDIKIPKIVRKKIAESVDVMVDFALKKK